MGYGFWVVQLASIGRYAGGFLSDTQVEGISFLYRGLPRSMLMLLGVFLIVYAALWGTMLIGAPSEVNMSLYIALGFIVGLVLAITLLRMWPRFESALPRWFQLGEESPELKKKHKYLAWALAALVVILCTVMISTLVFGIVMIMGVVGGIYLLFRMEGFTLRFMPSVKKRLNWFWKGGGWRVFFLLLFIIAAMIFIVTMVAIQVSAIKDQANLDQAMPMIALLVFVSIMLFLFIVVFSILVPLQLYRAWMRYQLRKGKTYGPRRMAVLNTHPASFTYYLTTVNLGTGLFFSVYLVLLEMQQNNALKAQEGRLPINLSGILIPGEVLDYVALASFVLAWVLLLVNLSGTAVRGGRRVLNRRVFASFTVFSIMILFLHFIVAQGNEYSFSIPFREMFILGIMVAPLFIIWHRWNVLATAERNKVNAPAEDQTPSV
jgi:hypothetical protein